MIREEHDHQLPDIDPAMIILGLGYATSFIVAIGWVASLLV